jgi:hypothetical protein
MAISSSLSVIVFARNATAVVCGSRNVRFSGRSHAHITTGGKDSTVVELRAEKITNRIGRSNMIFVILIEVCLREILTSLHHRLQRSHNFDILPNTYGT